MSHITLYYVDLVQLESQRERAEKRQFILGFTLIALVAIGAYLVRG